MHEPVTTDTKPHIRGGYDSAVHGRVDDHLNRWPFAKEIYGVATTGPREWSVRIGVYGEWGTGKTSVLNFIDTLARKDGHLVVRFNPWEYSERDAMWRAFVVAVYREVEKELGRVTGGKAIEAREWAQKIAGWSGKLLSGTASIWSDKAGGAVDHGLDFLKRGLSFGRGDLEGLNAVLEDRRLVVLIDDLDRTNRELVPEMLFAIKEIMDVGGFVFVCAFDPVVVGRVLGDYHKGFDDGLKFLEKIIDYPRWLPNPTREALLSLARQDITTHCPYVPVQSMEQVIDLLPCNPRALRQFIRLLALIKPQIERHRPDELNWPIILAANVIKISVPQLANLILEDQELWHKVHGVTLLERDNPEGKLEQLVGEHLAAIKQSGGRFLSDVEREQLKAPLMELARRLDAWTGVDEERMLYQLRIAEAPAAVTWKEFDEFVARWGRDQTSATAEMWIKEHCEAVGRSYQEVYGELFDATVKARQTAISQAVEMVTDADMNPMHDKADALLTLLACLTFELGQLDKPSSRVNSGQFELVFSAFSYYLGWTHSERSKQLREKEIAFILRLTNSWSADVAPLIRVMRLFPSPIEDSFEGEAVAALRRQIRGILVPKYARQLIDRFCEQGFVMNSRGRAEGASDVQRLLLDVAGPIWKDLRSEALAALASARSLSAVQQNAYQMLSWFDYLLRKEYGLPYAQAAEQLLKDDELRKALWTAAIAHPLNPRAVGSLSNLPDHLAKMGLSIELPEWWTRTIDKLGLGSKNSIVPSESVQE